MKSKQYPYKGNVLRKRVNHLSKTSNPFSGGIVNLFRMDKQMLKEKA